MEDFLFPELAGKGSRDISKDLETQVIRPLTLDDIESVLAPLETRVSPLSALRTMRSVHHQIARHMATGEQDVDISLLTGYTPQYITNLRKDPAFQELLSHYSAEREVMFTDTLERMRQVGLGALEELQARLEDDPAQWSRRELMEMTELLLVKPLTRGLSPGSSGGNAPSVGVTVNFVSAPEGQSVPQAHADKFPAKRSPPGVIDGEIIG